MPLDSPAAGLKYGFMRLTVVAVFLVAAGLTGCSSSPPQRAALAGTLDTLAEHPLPDALLVALAPCDETAATLELRFALEQELVRLEIKTSDQAPVSLAYCAAVVPLDELAGYFPDIAVAGTIGSSGSTEIGVGIGVPVLGGGGRMTRYRFEITTAIKNRDNLALWSGRAAGAAELYSFKVVAGTVAPLLLERLGSTDGRVPISDCSY